MNSRYGSLEMQRMRITIQKGCQKIDFTDVCRLSIVKSFIGGESRKAVFGPGPGPDSPRSFDLHIFSSSTTEDDSR